MVYTLIDDWVYLDIDGKPGIYGRQELDRTLRARVKNPCVAFLDYETKVVPCNGSRNVSQETLPNTVFDERYLTVQERLSENLIQVIASRKETVDEIYRYFNGSAIENLVPYSIAIRAFLKSKGLLNSHQCIVFLDDLRNQTLLTVFEENYFSSSRRISLRDASYMIAEIKRSWQNFLQERSNSGRGSDVGFTLVSNNVQWVSDFIEQGFLSKESIVHVDVPFMVLEGLKSAKFAVHFAPAQEIIKKKKRKLWINRLKALVLSLFLILLGVILYVPLHLLEQKEEHQYLNLKKQESHLRNQLKNVNRQKFLGLLNQDKHVSYSKVYWDFIQSVPAGYIVDDIKFEKDSYKNFFFQGDIYPANEYTQEKRFKKQLAFIQADISPVILNKTLGQRIVLNIKQKDKV